MRKNSATDFTLLVASAKTQPPASHEFTIGDKKATLTVEYGDFSDALAKAAAALKEVINSNISTQNKNLNKDSR